MGNWGTLRESRKGILLHYDASASDAGAVAWLTKDPRCAVSYNKLILDDGRVVEIAPEEARAWHAGVCRPSDPKRLSYADANSAFYGLSIAATVGDVATPAAKRSLAEVCHRLFLKHGWDPLRDSWRITGHRAEAWPRGRKVDPEGPNLLKPVLSVEEIRALVVGCP